MACENPRRIKNPAFLPSSKNDYTPQFCPDPRLKYITVPCGVCFSCLKRKSSDWRFRLLQEFKSCDPTRFHFVTLTFSDDWVLKLRSGYTTSKGRFIDGLGFEIDDNELCAVAVRRFLERYRKAFGCSLRHFFVTERGEHDGRIHLHGIVYGAACGSWKRNKFYIDHDSFTDLWQYGFTYLGWCNEKTISYVTKYITKFDGDFRSIILVSPAFGKGYITAYTIRLHNEYNDGEGLWCVYSDNGFPLAIPRYLRLNLFTPERLLERQLFLLDNPPDLILNGHNYYDDFKSYTLARDRYFEQNCRLGLSSKNFYLSLNIDIHENLEFLTF